MFWCTSSQALCTNTKIITVSGGTPITMVCWRDERAPFPNSSPRWFYVYLENGIEGYMWAPQIAYQTSTPACNTINWVNTTDWSVGHLGQTYASPAEAAQFTKPDWSPGPVGEWQGDCAKFVYLAWGKHTATGNAIDIYHQYLSARMIHTFPSRPPRGALVFFNRTSFGHVAISIGNWQAVGTQGLDNQVPINTIGTYNVNTPDYLGWAMPLTPTVPQDPS
jgi:hypothetical protein